jgi:hypothetical protein
MQRLTFGRPGPTTGERHLAQYMASVMTSICPRTLCAGRKIPVTVERLIRLCKKRCGEQPKWECWWSFAKRMPLLKGE